MKKIATTVLSLLFCAGLASAQTADIAPVIPPAGTPPTETENGSSGSRALWDVMFEYDVNIHNAAGMAGITFTGSEFWISRWASDSIFRLDASGNLLQGFTIPGITGIRSLTYVPQTNRIYAGVNTNTVRIIDVATQTAAGTITVPATTVRWITYDSTANANAGGFYVGNFGTNIFRIDMNGATISQTPAASHGLTGMYGAGFDNVTPGGPYLWIHDQTAGGGVIHQIVASTGTPTGISHNTATDVTATQTSTLAGGLDVAPWPSSPSGYAIIGVSQSAPTNILFGYELSAPAALTDVTLDSLRLSTPYFMTPYNHLVPVTVTGRAQNTGTEDVTTVAMNTSIDDAGTVVYTDSTSAGALVSGAVANITIAPAFTAPSTGDFMITSNVAIAPETDEDMTNDTLQILFSVTDSTFARDNGIANGSIGIGTGGGTLGTTYRMTTNDQVTSITAFFTAPTAGDSTKFELRSFTTLPGAVIATTPGYVFTNADTNGVEVTLRFATPINVTANTTYLATVREFTSNVTLATDETIFNPNTNWVIFGANPWQPMEFYGFEVQTLLRLNLRGCRSSQSQSVSICKGESLTVGQNTYTTAGTYTDVLSSVAGCDSTVITTLTVDSVNSSVSQAGTTLTANQGGLSYQWIDCADNSAVNGATAQSFTPAADGNYAVVVNDGSCSDTSACFTVSVTGIENHLQAQLSIYPNPTADHVFVNTGDVKAEAILVTDLTGRVLATSQPSGTITSVDVRGFAGGAYLVTVLNGNERATLRLIIQ